MTVKSTLITQNRFLTSGFLISVFCLYLCGQPNLSLAEGGDKILAAQRME
jgi:hypothetical protein